MPESPSPDHDATERDVPTERNPYLDASDRLERVIERQITTIDGIDTKAAHVTRLIGILIGLVFGVLSLLVNLDPGSLPSPGLPAELAFILGMSGLLIAMGAAIITYLSSKFRTGLHYDVGYYLSDPDAHTTFETHIRRVLGSHAEIIEQNKLVIEANSRRFRRTLVFLLTGVLFLSVSGAIYLGRIGSAVAWLVLLITVIVAGVSAWYILSGSYLTLQGVGADND